MKNTIKQLMPLLVLLTFFSCSKNSNNGNSESGIVRYQIDIFKGSEEFNITLNTNALDTKVIDLDTGELVPEDESIGGLVQTINDSRSTYNIESKDATINMNLSLSFIEKQISSGKPIEIEIQCFYNDNLQDTYNYKGTISFLGKFDFLFTPGVGFTILGEPAS